MGDEKNRAFPPCRWLAERQPNAPSNAWIGFGGPGDDRTLASADLISSVLGGIREALIALDGTDPKDRVHQILSVNGRTHGRTIPLAGVTVGQDALKDPMRKGRRDGPGPGESMGDLLPTTVPGSTTTIAV
ncbi:MAG: hypothetical protein M1294_13850 [Firmicutes bacterium]|nr:hypothetical protein [Bacillota bacterium]MCL5014745.1 hypothetical protein [Bacillota bacterium]